MVNLSDSLGPNADRVRVHHDPVPYTGPVVRNRLDWYDGRIYRHTDGVVCDAGQNETGLSYVGDYPNDVEVTICLVHNEEIVLAPRYFHTDDDTDCDARPDQTATSPEQVLTCTLHELPVEKVW